MDDAIPEPRSYGSEDTTKIHTPAQASQAETREEYIARIVSEAPPISRETLDRLAVLLRPTIQRQRANATPAISVRQYQSWEVKRYENAGQHGYYTADGEAA